MTSSLDRLLQHSSSPLDAPAAEALLAGLAAAPAGETDDWLRLFAPAPSAELAAELRRRLEDARAALPAEGAAPPERLDDLRAELARRGLDGFLVPRADEHQGEYVPLRAQRLGWLTGFSGSAGLAVVLRDRAAIFVDGRYTLQVRTEVDTSRFEPLHLIEQPPSQWLGETLRQGQRLGYDPWLHTPDQVRRFEAACQLAGAELVACDDNPLDAVWADQPPPPLAPVEPHPVALAGRSSAEKRAELAKQLAEVHQDAAILSNPDSIAWLLNVRGGDVPHTPLPLSFAILAADASLDWFLDRRKLLPEVAAHLGNGVRVRPPEELAAALDALKKIVRLDETTAPAWIATRLTTTGAKVVRGDDPCSLPKACKNERELDGMRAAHRRDGAALARFFAWLSTSPAGLTEISAADQLEEFRRRGEMFRGLSFPTIAGSGPNGAIVHYRATPQSDRPVSSGTILLLDSGAQYHDGTTDVTRTIAIGPVSDEARHRFTLVLKGHIALGNARFPAGTNGSQLDVLARQALWQEGLDYDHGTGHGVGSYLSVHEGPQRISKMPNTVALRPGMVLSNEPGYYKTGAYGIRIENLVAVTSLGRPQAGERDLLGFETLTLAPIDRAMVVPDLLTKDERHWLNSYHARVLAEIGPLVEPEVRAWLETACRPF